MRQHALPACTDEKGVEEVATPSVEQLEILAIVAYFGQASRALIERFRGEESHSLLERLVVRGLLARVRDKKVLGAPYVYSVTAKALRAAGSATPEAMRAAVAQEISAEQQMRLASAADETAGEDSYRAGVPPRIVHSRVSKSRGRAQLAEQR
jgi:hypothetical protein